MARSRSSGVVGAASMMCSTPAAPAWWRQSVDSSRERSPKIVPDTPCSASRRAKRSCPKRNAMLYDVIATKGTPTSAADSSLSTDSGVVPRSRARVLACWMTGPSMIGSEKGMPISMASAPASAAARTASSQSVDMPPHR